MDTKLSAMLKTRVVAIQVTKMSTKRCKHLNLTMSHIFHFANSAHYGPFHKSNAKKSISPTL